MKTIDLSFKERLLSAISYVPALNIFVIYHRDKEFIKINFNQAVTLLITESLILILFDIFFGFIGVSRNFFFIPLILLLPINIIAIVYSLRGNYFRIPIIGWDRKVLEDSLNNLEQNF
jgi:uncharacterized membrane protein